MEENREEIITKEIAQKLMKLKGETRGFNIKPDGEYILKIKGEEGLKKVEKELERLGYPIKYREIKKMDFIPAGLRVISLLVIKKTFNFNDNEIRKLCTFIPKTSLIVRLFIKYFYSIPVLMKKTQDIFRKHWSVGSLSFIEYNEKEKYAILRIENLNLHFVACRCFEGYFQSFTELVIGKKEITCEETKCFFKGDKFHEYLIKW